MLFHRKFNKLTIVILLLILLLCIAKEAYSYSHNDSDTEYDYLNINKENPELRLDDIFTEDVVHSSKQRKRVEDMTLMWKTTILRVPDAVWVLQPFHDVGVNTISAFKEPEPASSDHGYLNLDDINRLYRKVFSNQKDKNFAVSLSERSAKLVNMTDQCEIDITYTLESLMEFDESGEWAFQMFDAAGKLTSGFLKGSFQWLGSYKECIDVSAPQGVINGTDVTFGGFSGQYCQSSWFLKIFGKANIPLNIGICVPSSCRSDKIQKEIKSLWKKIGSIPILNGVTKNLSPSRVVCKSDSIPWKTGDIVVLVLFSIIGALLVMGTTYDVFQRFYFDKRENKVCTNNQLGEEKHPIDQSDSTAVQSKPGNVEITISSPHSAHFSNPECNEAVNTINNELEVYVPTEAAKSDFDVVRSDSLTESFFPKPRKSALLGAIGDILLCFSVYTNGAKLLDATPPKGQLGCVHGIRFLSMSWVILGHTYLFGYPLFENFLEVLELVNTRAFEAVIQGPFSVDTFFLLSGLLVTYLFLRESHKSRTTWFKWVYFYVHRFWRLTPTLMLLLAFDAVLWKHLGSGPYWPEEGTEGTKCSNYWWRNLLYINNMWNQTYMCMPWTWYLANDMQFYIISPLFLSIFKSHTLISVGVVGGLMLTSWISTGVLSSVYKLNSMFMQLRDAEALIAASNDQQAYFNIIYIKPWCRIGPYLVGVIVSFLLYRTGKRTNFLNKWLVLLCWLIAAGLCLSVVYGTYHVDMSNSTTSLYNTLSRTAWAVGVGWVIYACVTGHGGFIDTLLSWRFWIPLSRLTYCAYLIHPLVMYWYYLSSKTTMYVTHPLMVINFLAFTVVSYSLALMASLAFESPMMALEKFIVSKIDL
ncbi:O-acyltransferase like protein-like [Limulus polyphemus]|uniref:O-acyltransferase like protein-like n=1 Tax=Limulus polyphemus TaxID=6850 RepID=A0ABM1B7N4_LIMPO|nr:O-acyltransferase like protein-like [Limulus polyphemus]